MITGPQVREYTKRLADSLNDDKFKVFYFEESDVNINYKYKHNCGFGQTILKIDPNGDVFPCLLSEIKYANINKMTITEIQKKYSRIWENVHSPSKLLCGNCEKIEVCRNCICEGDGHCSCIDEKFNKLYNEIKNKIYNIQKDI